MDPISVAASAIAIATLASQIGTIFVDLRSLCRSLPGRMHALNNEVADLEIVLLELASVTKKRRAVLHDDDQSAIPHLLEQTNTKLVELQNIVDRLRSACRDTRIPILAANLLRQESSRLQTLQEDIRNIKCNLNIMLGASNSQDMMHMRLDLESISVVTTRSLQEHIALRGQLVNGFTGVDERLARMEEMLRAHADQLRENQYKQVGPLYNKLPARRRDSLSRRKISCSKSMRSEGFGVRVTPHTMACHPGCRCACHTQQKVASPGILHRLFGQLFIGYAGLPYVSPKCDNETCKKSRASKISMEYWFPVEFLSSTIVRMQAGYQPNTGILFQLKTFRSVPDNAQCINFALNGDIEGLKYLFSKGLASPRDVSPTRGYTLLRWALYGKQYETCEFLIHAGTDPDYRPFATSDNSPRIKACHFLLEGGLPDAGVDVLRLITKGGYYEDFIDESGFTTIHRIVLGLLARSLEEELILHSEDINKQDAMGRTPLAWAAARGDSRSVVTLLSHGADPDIIDVQMSGPVSNAAARGYTACVRLLLEAGAAPDPPIPSNILKGSPLNVASRNATDVLILKCLLDFGANVDSRGTDGNTALIHAARTDNSSFALLLLEYGADINAYSLTGDTPLDTAISYNSHNVLRLILDRWHEYSDCPRLKAPHLLQTVALYADVETLQILIGMDHLRMRHDKNYTVGDFKSRLNQRPDLTDELVLAFSELLDVINATPNLTMETPDDLLEPGFVSCSTICVGSDSEREKEDEHNLGMCPRRAPSRIDSKTTPPDSPLGLSFVDALESLNVAAEV